MVGQGTGATWKFTGEIQLYLPCVFLPLVRPGYNFSRVCACVCLFTWTVTSEFLQVAILFAMCILTLFWSSLSIMVTGSRSNKNDIFYNLYFCFPLKLTHEVKFI